MKNNSYIQLAEMEYRMLKTNYNTAVEYDWYNSFIFSAHQIIEKSFKSIVEFEISEDTIRLLKSHNLRKLTEYVNKIYNYNFSEEKASWLTNFYFDSRYPGDDFVCVTKAQADKAYDIVLEFYPKISKLFCELTETIGIQCVPTENNSSIHNEVIANDSCINTNPSPEADNGTQLSNLSETTPTSLFTYPS